MKGLGPDDRVLCAGTVPAAGFAERLAAAAEAGFSGVSLFLDDYQRAREQGHGDAELRRMLADHGLGVAELDPLLDWLPGAGLAADATAEGASFFGHGEDAFYAAADALGARSINAVAYADPPPERALLVDAFGALCRRAAAHGLLVHLEFLPWTPVPDAAAALAIAEAAGCDNGGILLDSWHHFRSGLSNEALARLPGQRVLAVQLSDAPAAAEPDPVEETLHRRLLPGQGDADLAGLLRTLDAMGCRAPLGVEVFSDELAALPPAEAARRAGRALDAVLTRARR